jgi:hypothetical protein
VYACLYRLRSFLEIARVGQGVELVLAYLPETGMAVYLAQRFGEGTLPDDLARVIAPAYRGQSLPGPATVLRCRSRSVPECTPSLA